MKKILSIALAAAMMCSLAACGEKPSTGNEDPDNVGENGQYSVTIRLAHDSQPNLPTSDLMEVFEKEVEERSNGQIQIEMYPNGQLSGNNAQTTANLLTNGDIDMAVLNSVTTQRWEIYKFPYLFTSLEDAYKCEDGESGRYMLDTLEEDANVHGICYLDVGFRVFTGKEAFNDVNALQGKKLRIINSTTFTEFAKALNANPVSTSMGELYTALQQGAADCQENPLSVINSQGFHNVTPYITMTNHVWNAYVLGVNLDFWNTLPDEAKAVLEEVSTEISAEHRTRSEARESEFQTKLESEGATIVELTDAEREAWAAVGRSTHQTLEDLVGAEVVDVFYKDLGIEKSW